MAKKMGPYFQAYAKEEGDGKCRTGRAFSVKLFSIKNVDPSGFGTFFLLEGYYVNREKICGEPDARIKCEKCTYCPCLCCFLYAFRNAGGSL
jgi:hypothetical protein